MTELTGCAIRKMGKQGLHYTIRGGLEMSMFLIWMDHGLGDVHDVLTEMDEIIFFCRHGRIKEARDKAETIKRNIAMSRDLSGRPYMGSRFKEVMGIIDRAERERKLL